VPARPISSSQPKTHVSGWFRGWRWMNKERVPNAPPCPSLFNTCLI